MASRGPDGHGLWIREDGGLGLAHRRLAILDLSDAGLQPMEGPDGSRIVFNGEIYNFRELKRELEADGERFETASDTEVLLAMYRRFGADMLSRIRGMFAFALWDQPAEKLLLARDPYGIKPLYLAESDGYLRFASQVRALEAGGAVSSEIDPAGVVGFLLWGSVPEPLTIRRSIRALPAGHFLVVENGRVGAPSSYHSFRADPGPEEPVAEALAASVRAHLVSDVPVAVFLSSGIDSTLLAGLAARHGETAPTTLTVQFDRFVGTELDEAPLARTIAASLGTRHIEHLVRREDFLDLWPAALAAMDQPSIDGFNTFLISRVAREEGFKVVMSGLGGDELMGGYDTFLRVPAWERRLRWARFAPGAGKAWRWIAGLVAPSQPKLRGLLDFGTSLQGAYFLSRGLFLPDDVERLLGADVAREGLERLRDARIPPFDPPDPAIPVDDPWRAVHLLESTRYMRDRLLRDSDWASMAHSVELRVPLVDARLRDAFERAGFRPARGGGKREVLRRAVAGLPEAVFERRKTGFFIPVTEWIENTSGDVLTRAEASRRLAHRVLGEFGVEVRAAA